MNTKSRFLGCLKFFIYFPVTVCCKILQNNNFRPFCISQSLSVSTCHYLPLQWDKLMTLRLRCVLFLINEPEFLDSLTDSKGGIIKSARIRSPNPMALLLNFSFLFLLIVLIVWSSLKKPACHWQGHCLHDFCSVYNTLLRELLFLEPCKG